MTLEFGDQSLCSGPDTTCGVLHMSLWLLEPWFPACEMGILIMPFILEAFDN